MGKHKAFNYLSSTGLELLQNTKQPMLSHHQTGSEAPFKWRSLAGRLWPVLVTGYLYWFDVGLPCLKYLESIARIRDVAFKFVSLRPKSHLIAPYR